MRISTMALLIGLGATGFGGGAIAQDADKSDEIVVVTGTRAPQRTKLTTSAPVDVIGAAQLTQLGVSELNQALSVSLPSLNFPRPGLADGTDSIRPATLRGLAPDQTLVLLNSKRRHSSSLVNVNGTVGRGSAAVDMNTIPSAIVSSVEVLRDGSSAQYGSDAIAGVVNVRLKEESSGGGLNISFGERVTEVDTIVDAVPTGANWSLADKAKYKRHDGQTLNVNGWVGIPITENGYLTLAFEALHQEKTVRTAPDWRQQYPTPTAGGFDPREATFNRYNAWYGEPEIDQLTVFANAGVNLSDTTKIYGWLSNQDRKTVSAGFFRRANDARNVIEIYPDGFLPLIAPEINDFSAAGGIQWKALGWNFDASVVRGYNKMAFTIKNTLNRSYGTASKKEFNAGGFDYGQTVFNLNADKAFPIGMASPLNLAVGLEARNEEYSIFAGEPTSYLNGGVLLNGSPTASGAQVFPGFRPENETSPNRSSLALYVDGEVDITDKFMLSGAIRAEDYDDFGSTTTGKISGRFEINDQIAIRASAQNGFRAPSMQQIGFTTTSTNFINGVPFDITTFTPDSTVAKALGAKPLEPEKSVNYAAGVVFDYGKFTLTIDAYQINIDNRIVLSENLTRTEVRNYLIAQGITGVGGGRFFINGVDTETKGLDIIANYRMATNDLGKFTFTFGANFNDTNVTRVPSVPSLSAWGYAADGLFARVNKLTFEQGTPKDKFNFSTDWSFGKIGATFRATRYGEVLSPGTSGVAGTSGADLILSPKTLVDLEARYKLNDKIRFAIGADNVFDVYPDQTPAILNSTSNTPFSNLSPFGRSGRYVYGKVSFDF